MNRIDFLFVVNYACIYKYIAIIFPECKKNLGLKKKIEKL